MLTISTELTNASDDTDTPEDKWIAFPELSDEDTPTTCSDFEGHCFETCLPHLKTAGGIRVLINKLLFRDEELRDEDTPTFSLSA